MLRLVSLSLLLTTLSPISALAQGAPPSEPGIVRSAAPDNYVPVRRKHRLGGGFIEFIVNGGELAGPPAYVVNQGQPGYNGRGDLPSPYIAPEPRWRADTPAYIVNQGQAGFNGRGDLPDTQTGSPVPAPRRRLLAWGGDYATAPAYASAPEPAAPVRSTGFDPKFARQLVAYDGPQAPGTIVINTSERFLYLVQPDGKALRYGVGVGREGFEWTGTRKIERKAEWPDWHPPSEMLKRRPDLPTYMAGGPSNPLGARAMYLGGTLYRIHGSNEPQSIGHAVSSGCIRLRNEDVIDLYNRVGVGTAVVVM